MGKTDTIDELIRSLFERVCGHGVHLGRVDEERQALDRALEDSRAQLWSALDILAVEVGELRAALRDHRGPS